jgi:hypothetical protein
MTEFLIGSHVSMKGKEMLRGHRKTRVASQLTS